MKTFKHYLSLILIGSFVLISLVSFKIMNGFNTPSESIYTQTDRPFYFPGETIWFKSYVVEQDNTVSNLSDIMHAELISPKGSVVSSLNLSIKEGYSYGDFYIDEDWVGGIYTLKVYTNWMRNYGEESFFTKKITVQKVVQPNLLMTLKFEKEGYGKASDVVANFEVKDLKNFPLADKEMTFEVSIKGKPFLTKSFRTDDEGKANPSFRLPDDLQSSDVVLNILIPYQGTTESISRAVPVVLDTIDLQFFPESGNLVAGTINTVAFKALSEFAKPVDVSGQILDEQMNVVSTFDSFHDGMGSFEINIQPNTTYYARILQPFRSERNIKLPTVQTSGTRFSLNTDSLKTKLSIFSTDNERLFLEVSNASKVLLEKSIKPMKDVVLETEAFPMGITKFTLKNKQGAIVAERLAFLNANKTLKVKIQSDKEVYNTREKVKLSITTTDENNNPIPSNLSISVADNKLLSFADDKQDHILSYLLLSSELKGSIYKPSFYLNPKEPKSITAIDYLMLTHGWRTYVSSPEITLDIAEFLPERYSVQNGVVFDKKGNPTKAHLLLFDQYGNKVLVFDTKDDGTFSFKFSDDNNLILMAYRDDGTSLSIRPTDVLKGRYSPASTAISKPNNEKVKEFSKMEIPVNQPIKQKAVASVALTEDASALDEVVVVGYGIQKKSNLTGAVSVVTAEEIMQQGKSIPNTLQGMVAGVQVTQNNGRPGTDATVVIRGVSSISGNNEPLIVVDGVPVDQKMLSDLDASQVNSVSILKDAAATSLYGCMASNGVIIVSTKNAPYIYNYGKKILNKAKYNNYAVHQFSYYRQINTYTAQKFYVPQYDGSNLPEERTDFRQTIYWNPVVQTDEQGKAELEFYNSDAITSFKITAEGVGYNGLVGRQEETYATKKLLNLDFKAPNYMALNDVVLLPVTISNETDSNINAELSIELPKHLKLAETLDSTIKIAPNSTLLKTVKVIPIEKTENAIISMSLQSKDYSDVVKKEVTILSPYFPTQMSLSGSESKFYNFEINNPVKGSIETSFNIYTDVVGDVMNGIESLISQPYGCFEQTSSTTYPNILVLKYLKESGKNNPEIERKAMNFIKQGYNRLIGFETREGGFEWFGHTPPHETLTAYGILEFTEMKEIYSGVDQEMIDRTVKWLLSRKDGKGGFKKSEKGYDSFASSPVDVANAYIVYALSEAKLKIDIDLEFNTAYNDAINSNDTYIMALMTLASYNLNKQQKATLLLQKIKANIERYGFKDLPVENTITRSYGNAKNIETNALSLLALMKEGSENVALVAQGIEYLVAQRQHNRFGSTQSTAMALKALIEYTKQQKQVIINSSDSVELSINGTALNRALKLNNLGVITIDGISDLLNSGKQNVSVRFTNPKTSFPYTLNVKWDNYVPDSSNECLLNLKTTITEKDHRVGDNVSMSIEVSNVRNERLGMATAIIGIPSGTTAQPWQLKELLEQNKFAYYEVFDNYLVFYWKEFGPSETKNIRLDLKADIAGTYKAPASTVYLYYGDEHKTWIEGSDLEIFK
ncbi:TonB-dependent receptor plug domain-containing protein [Subsaxibacter sp. CAU 1640]|uniref:TonB-dependent receptor plug domain-containing protein n=1 Tax=Subsaxibacter sp. CAU 1640 TaxID=2933271 RepID=UPI0020065116|nr:TonB-dependent receptor plug domain-containing protein [Subsaxibacter sp. CAU 1640]MCK7589419.1 TonB-dependent receptor plug domain-containing protein [Subsaxibacter sp. CAU 1640]